MLLLIYIAVQKLVTCVYTIVNLLYVDAAARTVYTTLDFAKNKNDTFLCADTTY